MKWCYLYSSIDRDGNLVDVRLSRQRNKTAAKAFIREAPAITKICPDRVMTDGHKPYSDAINTELGDKVKHRTNRYLNNCLELDHRGRRHLNKFKENHSPSFNSARDLTPPKYYRKTYLAQVS